MSIAGQFASAWESPLFYIGELPANADLSAKQYLAVVPVASSGAGIVEPAALAVAGAGVAILGILQNNPQLGEAGQVMQAGISKAVAGAALATIGTILMSNASGQLIAATAGNFGVAMSLQVSGALGNIIAVLVANFGKQ